MCFSCYAQRWNSLKTLITKKAVLEKPLTVKSLQKYQRKEALAHLSRFNTLARASMLSILTFLHLFVNRLFFGILEGKNLGKV